MMGMAACVERLERLVDRRGGIETVDLKEIDVIELQPVEAFADPVVQMPARRSARVRAFAPIAFVAISTSSRFTCCAQVSRRSVRAIGPRALPPSDRSPVSICTCLLGIAFDGRLVIPIGDDEPLPHSRRFGRYRRSSPQREHRRPRRDRHRRAPDGRRSIRVRGRISPCPAAFCATILPARLLPVNVTPRTPG